MTTTPKFPDVVVELTGRDGNAFSIIGACTAAARRAGVSKADRDAFTAKAMNGDYDNLLRTAMRWFDVS
jgi:hypothetical protein